MANTTETARATVYLDGKKAGEELKKLRKEANLLKSEMDSLKLKGDKVGFETKKREFDSVKKKIDEARRSTFDLQQVLKNLNGTSLKELERAQKQLTNEIRNSSRATREDQLALKAKGEQLKAVRAQMTSVRAEMNLTSVQGQSSMNRLADSFNRFQTIGMAVIASLAGILMGAKQAISTFSEFDDALADVMKTSGLTRDKVLSLNEELKKINTRSAQIDLLAIARVAGKLGYDSVKDINGFVKAADQIKVALTEDLGGDVEESIRQLGKLTDIFNLKEEFGIEQALLKTGSAINALGASSTANEGFIVEFAKRVAGVAPSANISMQDVMGLAATLDQLGQTSEVSSTVFSQIIPDMFRNTAAYAKTAGMGIEEFSQLLKTDANEAMIRLFQGLNGNNAGIEYMVKVLDELGIEGKRSVSVLGVLANNVGLLRDTQRQSNLEFAKGTSLTEEFNVKNNTMAAKLEKARKNLYNVSVELGERLAPALSFSTNSASYLIKAMMALFNIFSKYGPVILSSTAAIVGYYTAVKIQTMWTNRSTAGTLLNTIATKASVIAKEVATMATQLAAAAYMFLTGNIKGATQAMRVFNATIKASPLGLIASIAMAAGAALYSYWQTTKEATIELMSLTEKTLELQKEKQAEIIREKNELNSLVNQIIQTNVQSDLRNKLISDLQEKYPDFLANINLESLSNETLAAKLGIVNQEYTEKMRLAALSAKSEAVTKKMVDNEARKLDIEEDLANRNKVSITPGTKLEKEKLALEAEFEKLTQENKSWEAMLKDLDKRIADRKKTAYSDTVDWWTAKVSELNYSISVTKDNIKKAKDQGNQLNEKHFAEALASYEAEMTLAKSQLAAAELRAKEDEAEKKYGPKSVPTGSGKGGAADLKTKYELLGEEIKKAKLQLQEFTVTGDLEKALQAGRVVEELEKALAFLDKIIAANGDLEKVIDEARMLQSLPTDSKYAGAASKFLGPTPQTGVLSNEDKPWPINPDDLQDFSNAQNQEDLDNAIQPIPVPQLEKIPENYFDTEFYLSTIQSASDAGFQIWRNAADAKLEYELYALDSAMERELGNKNLTEEQKNKIREKYAQKERKIKQESFKKQRIADIIQSVINTALGVVNALATGGPAAPALAIAAGLAGLAQTAIIASQPMPRFFEGGPTGQGTGLRDDKGELAGVVHANEYVIPEWMRSLPKVIAFERVMEGIRLNKGTSSTLKAVSEKSPSVNFSDLVAQPDTRLVEVLEALNSHIEKGIKTKFILNDFEMITAKLADIEEQSSL